MPCKRIGPISKIKQMYAITPNLSQLAADGARGAVRPSFPSKTYPNHYTLVTGLRPDRHGLVDNVMVDPLIPGVTFKLSDRATVKDPRWWNDATPLWVTAERQGVISASVFWPGSETAIQGAQPTYWLTYDQTVSAPARVDQVLAWLTEDGATISEALLALLVELEPAGAGALVVDMVEQGLDEPTQEALIAYLRRRRPDARPLFLMTRSCAILDLAAVGPDPAETLQDDPGFYVWLGSLDTHAIAME